MPINSLNNILIDYVNECSGNGYYTFKTNKDYTDFMKRLQSLKGITNEIIDKMIAIQDKDKFAWKNSGEWADLQYDLMDIDAKLKKTCSYLSSEISEKFEQGFPIFEDDKYR